MSQKPAKLHVTQLSSNKRAFSFRETSHIKIPPEVSIKDGTYVTFNFVLYPIKKPKVFNHQLSIVLCRAKFDNALWNDLTDRCC